MEDKHSQQAGQAVTLSDAGIEAVWSAMPDHIGDGADHHRLVHELDVLLNGKAGAASQASLCDIVAQVRQQGIRVATPVAAEPARCRCCGYLVTESEHRGCLRAAEPTAPTSFSCLNQGNPTATTDVEKLIATPAFGADEVNPEVVDTWLNRVEQKVGVAANALPHDGLPAIGSDLKDSLPTATPPAADRGRTEYEFLDVDNHRLRRAMQKLMARLAALLDEDQFSECEGIVTAAGVQPPPAADGRQEDGGALSQATKFYTGGCFIRFVELPDGVKMEHVKGDTWRVILSRASSSRADVESAIASELLPGVYYMDLPDGGSVTPMDQLRRMAKDAARYRWLAAWGKTDGFSPDAIDREIAVEAMLAAAEAPNKEEGNA